MSEAIEEPDIAVAAVADYPDNAPLEEQRRAFVLSHMASAEIDGSVLVKNLAAVEAWLRDGTVPATTTAKTARAALKPVG